MDNQWVRSSFCADKSCVEVKWISPSACRDLNCVEVAVDADDILIRDSKSPDGPTLRFTPDEWTAFVGGVKAGEFDR